jgi:hypothetical protein
MADLNPSERPEVLLPPTITQTPPILTDPIPTDAPDICVDPDAIPTPYGLKKGLRDKVRAHNSSLSAKIHRFPPSLRGFGDECHYIVPKMVAIGPYHRHLPELQAMEVVKETASLYFCGEADVYLEACERQVIAVAGAARSCYDADSLEGVSDTDFVSMMVRDACFLLATIHATMSREEPDMLPVLCGAVANTPVVLTDIFLLENQIPWVVLEALMTLSEVDLSAFISMMGMKVQSRIDRQARPLELGNYKPPHLLGLFHFYQSGGPPEKKRDEVRESGDLFSHLEPSYNPSLTEEEREALTERIIKFRRAQLGALTAKPANSILEKLPLGTSAIELAEIGIKLILSKTSEFKDIGLTEGPLFRKIFLPSLRLNANTACWLLNMAAFEVCTALHDDEYIVSSYLALFAMFMHREEDVHELRANHLIHGEFTNKQTLDFFTGRHAGNLRPGKDFYSILRRLERYKQRYGPWIAIHKFVYNNVKIIVAVLSITGVLVGIFKTLLSIKNKSS